MSEAISRGSQRRIIRPVAAWKSSVACLIAITILNAGAQEQTAKDDKAALLGTLRHIQDVVWKIRESVDSSRLRSMSESIYRAAEWLAGETRRWSPRAPGEGKPLQESLERMLQALRNAPAGKAELETLLTDVREDIAIKQSHCRAKGLAAPQRVTVVPKKNGLEEVNGLEVLYIEKFFESDPNHRPLLFRRFSSPAVDDLVPGKYLIWARAPGTDGVQGERKEARIGSGIPKDAIEVLAP